MEHKPIVDVIDVADEILVQCRDRDIEVSPMKLMKLAYIAHGWHLALEGESLFDNRVEAWKYGPVMPDLYHATKKHARSFIPRKLITGNGSLPAKSSFISEILDIYGKYTAIELSSMTHQSNSPWQQVYRDGESDIQIPNNLIAEHYKGRLLEHQNSSAA